MKQSLAVGLLVLALCGSAAVCKLVAAHATPALRTKEVPLLEISHQDADQLQQFPESFPLQVAVFWTNPGPDAENPLPLVHSLKEMGIPFFITRDLPQALRHRLVILYPSVDSHTFTEPQADLLTTFVRQGGFIFAQNVFWGGLQNLFGFRSFAPSRKRYHLAFTATKDPVTKYLNRPEERETQLGSDHFPEIIWSNGYVPDPGAEVLAHFEDGSAALLTNSVGKGKVYLLGLSLLDVVLRNQNNRDYEAQRHYVNAFEPGADVWLLVLRAWYEAYGKDWVRLSTIPGGQRSALLLSHDVDWENSFAPGLDFARIEKANQASSTFFIQTKYVDDANSKAFFFAPKIDLLRQLKTSGSTVGSIPSFIPEASISSSWARVMKLIPVINLVDSDSTPPREPPFLAKFESARNCWTEKFRVRIRYSSALGTSACRFLCRKPLSVPDISSTHLSPPTMFSPIFRLRFLAILGSKRTAKSMNFRLPSKTKNLPASPNECLRPCR